MNTRTNSSQPFWMFGGVVYKNKQARRYGYACAGHAKRDANESYGDAVLSAAREKSFPSEMPWALADALRDDFILD